MTSVTDSEIEQEIQYLERIKRIDQQIDQIECVKDRIYKDLESDINQACAEIAKLIRDAKPTTASVMAGGSTIQCRVRALGRIYRTSACDEWIRDADLSVWGKNLFIGTIIRLFKLDNHSIIDPLRKKALDLATERIPKISGHFQFTDQINSFLEKPEIYPECEKLVKEIYAKFRVVLYQGNLEQKKQAHELRKALKKLKPILLDALRAGLTDEDLQTLVDESRVEIVMKS